MNICIYTRKREPDATFKGREHIFPAGIGGRLMLPQGYVSDEANNSFSSLELDFTRNSLIALARQHVGPGKRGSLSPKSASKSNIYVMFSGEMGELPFLGYITLGTPEIIDQMLILSSAEQMFLSHPDPESNFESRATDFISRFRRWDGKYTLLENSELGSTAIIGERDNKWYLGARNPEAAQDSLRIIDAVKSKQPSLKVPSVAETQVRVHHHVSFDVEYYSRVCAKIAFNYLAVVKGIDTVMHPQFDPIRTYILTGGENEFVRPVDTAKNPMPSHLRSLFPADSHKVFLNTTQRGIGAFVSFYGDLFPVTVELSKKSLHPIYDGIVCDWRNRREINFMDSITRAMYRQEP